MGLVSSKNSDRKRAFWDGRNFAPGHFCPQSRHLVCLAHKIGEVWFSTKIQLKTCFWEKRIREGFWGKIEQSFRLEQFSPRTHHIANYAQKWGMGPVSTKNSERKRVFWDGRNFAPGHFCHESRYLVRLAHKIGEVRFSAKIQSENVFLGKTNPRGFLGKVFVRNNLASEHTI